MQYRDVKARCLFCQAVVKGNQEILLGRWEFPDDLRPEWKIENDRIGRHWLWNGVCNWDTGQYQDYYLCPEHNDPDHFNAASRWATEQVKKGVYIDFTEPTTNIVLPEPMDKGEEQREPLPSRIPNDFDKATQNSLPDNWEYQDIRLEGCPAISYAIVDTWDAAWSDFDSDKLSRYFFPPPLELAEAMRKAADRIERLTRKKQPQDATSSSRLKQN